MKYFHNTKIFSGILVVIVLAVFTIGCSDNVTDSNNAPVQPPEQMNVTEHIPTNLQTSAPQAYSGVVTMQSLMNIGHDMYSEVDQKHSVSDGVYGEGDFTITYSAEPEERNGRAGTMWSVVFNGTLVDGDSSITFENDKVFFGWTANDGSAGNYTFDFSAYTEAQNMGGTGVNTYTVDWTTDSNGTITMNSSMQMEGESIESTLVLNEDGSGSYTSTHNYSDGTSDSYSVEWDANGNVTSQG